MGEEMITTGVDELIVYLRGKDKVALQDAATVLGVPAETVQAWADFLVEEKILGIEYKFTKPFLYLNRDTVPIEQGAPHADEAPTLASVRDAFAAHAREKQIPTEKIPALWRAHLSDALDAKRDFFIEQAIKRNAPDALGMFSQYRKDLLARYMDG